MAKFNIKLSREKVKESIEDAAFAYLRTKDQYWCPTGLAVITKISRRDLDRLLTQSAKDFFLSRKINEEIVVSVYDLEQYKEVSNSLQLSLTDPALIRTVKRKVGMWALENPNKIDEEFDRHCSEYIRGVFFGEYSQKNDDCDPSDEAQGEIYFNCEIADRIRSENAEFLFVSTVKLIKKIEDFRVIEKVPALHHNPNRLYAETVYYEYSKNSDIDIIRRLVIGEERLRAEAFLRDMLSETTDYFSMTIRRCRYNILLRMVRLVLEQHAQATTKQAMQVVMNTLIDVESKVSDVFSTELSILKNEVYLAMVKSEEPLNDHDGTYSTLCIAY